MILYYCINTMIQFMAQKWTNKEINILFKAILSLKTLDETQRFFRDLCTLEEIEEMSERWLIARLLNKNISYREIARKTGISTTTISRVAHWLNHGEGGYKLVLKRKKYDSNK